MSPVKDWECIELFEQGLARCGSCRTVKELDHFTLELRRPNGHATYCRQCRQHKRRKHYERSGGADHSFERHLKYHFNLTIDEYNAMAAEQDGRCYICKRIPSAHAKKRRVLELDHNHKTGKHRRLLCHTCNLTVAALERDPSVVAACTAYLEEFAEDSR